MMEKRLSELDENVLNLFERDGSWYKMQLIFDIGQIKDMSHITVQRKIKELKERGFIERWQPNKNLKGVYYRRCEGVRIEKLINDTVEDIGITLAELPGEMSETEKKLIEGSRTVAEGKRAVEILRSEPTYLKGLITFMLKRKVLALLNDTLPPKHRNRFRYEVRLVPKD
jgi:predicted transcriptional regulator